MKSEHRHELKTNELAEFLEHFPEWFNKHLKTIIYIAVVVVLVIGAYIWKRYQSQVVNVGKDIAVTKAALDITGARYQSLYQSMEGTDASYTFGTAAESLYRAAQSARTSDSAALALLKSAQALRLELHYRLDEVTEQEKTDIINNAISRYNEAIEK